MSDFNAIKFDDQHKTINAVKNAVPKTIEAIDSIVSSTINILGYIPNTINEYVQYSLDKTREKLHQKLNGVPAENIIPPPVHIAAPALQAACYAADCDELHDMFATLLASAMNVEKQPLVHPAFIEVIKQLSPIEARVLSHQSFISADIFPTCIIRIQETGSPHPLGQDFRSLTTGHDWIKNIALYGALENEPERDLQKISSITDNLSRLQIVLVHNDQHWLSDPNQYNELLTVFRSFSIEHTVPLGQELAFIPSMAEKTAFGKQFFQSCIL